ncbi:hypothetical protein HETIRDRAFT_326433 [Heterobasidion irregulare TC 32-1]|uniref:Uncharacterized protein n=1 Tax=Heterobasidion irregulare (strain TC 32-1) TaxID=747525 RepID=W4JVN8_HETIT|nr:uncharacterized protein HETIRDRAFT_326433 [Heterobasidion irregulare TC 32-1]ETW77607.1 hypothetical protein HETIRDRAFT_326433 [Heterobasidion irregulare TC 32-1]
MLWDEFTDNIGIPSHQRWLPAVVKTYACVFLRLWVMMVPGRNGPMIASVTLIGWAYALFYCIYEYTHDEGSVKQGVETLIKGSLYRDIQDKVKSIVKEFNLPRTRQKPMYYGRPESCILLQEAMRSSVLSGHPVKIQDAAIIVMSMYLGVCLGSLAVPYKKWLKECRVSTQHIKHYLKPLTYP